MTDPRFGRFAEQYDAFLNVSVNGSNMLTYAKTGAPINSNPYFETNAAGWGAFGGTLIRDNAHAYEGSWSGKYTSDNVSQFCGFSSADFTVTQNENIWLEGALWPTVRMAELKVDWYNAAHVRIDQSSLGDTTLAGQWNFKSGLIQAFPAGVAFGQITCIMTNFPPNTSPFWGDILAVYRTEVSAQATAVLAPHGETWEINRIAVKASTSLREATCYVYRNLIGDNYIVSSTFSGSSGDENNTAITLRDGDQLWVVWDGGDPGATYTVTVNGWRSTPEGGFRVRSV